MSHSEKRDGIAADHAIDSGGDGPDDRLDPQKRAAVRRVWLQQRIGEERRRFEARHDPFSSRNLFGRLGAMAATIAVALALPLLDPGDGSRMLVLLGISASLLLGPVIFWASRSFARTLRDIVRNDTERELRGRRRASFNAVVSIGTVIIAYAALYAFIGFHDTASGAGVSHDFGAALFLSLTTMTTTGYGDLTVFGWGRLVSSAEQITGVLMFAAFVSALMKFSEHPTPPPPMARVRVLEMALAAGKDDAWVDLQFARAAGMGPDQLDQFIGLLNEELAAETQGHGRG